MKLDLYAERLIYRKKECLYAERNGYFPYWNDLNKIVLPNQELSVLYGGPTLNYGDNYPCMFPICCA